MVARSGAHQMLGHFGRQQRQQHLQRRVQCTPRRGRLAARHAALGQRRDADHQSPPPAAAPRHAIRPKTAPSSTIGHAQRRRVDEQSHQPGDQAPDASARLRTPARTPRRDCRGDPGEPTGRCGATAGASHCASEPAADPAGQRQHLVQVTPRTRPHDDRQEQHARERGVDPGNLSEAAPSSPAYSVSTAALIPAFARLRERLVGFVACGERSDAHTRCGCRRRCRPPACRS